MATPSIKVTLPLEQISDRLSYDATTNSLQFDLAVVSWVADGFISVGQTMKRDTEVYNGQKIEGTIDEHR